MLQDNKPVSLWEMLKKYTCVIPIIQRDYAQGRLGKEQLRKRFFRQLIEAVVNHTPITLDFVYGTPAAHNDGVIYPLDGQQRLTSLWLLYWYVAFRTEKLEDPEVRSTLEKFTYHTRTSSRDFCIRICRGLIGDNSSAAKLIADQPWFSRRFKMDPTVQAMLRSLSDEEYKSGFEQMLVGDKDYNEIWNRLISKDCPVKFYFRSTKDEKISNPDDLYIKMNARGKKLTDFENFKSELFSFKGNDGKEVFRDGSNFIKKFENEWTNLFWTLRHKEKNIADHIQFEFFNRMVLAHIVAAGDIKDADKEIYDHITKHKRFSSIDVYRHILTPEFKTFYESVMNGIINVTRKGEDLNALFVTPYAFSYLPIYENSENDKRNIVQIGDEKERFWISDITVARLCRFYAASLYFSKIKGSVPFDKDAFNDWMIFSRNLFDNSGINEYTDTKNIIKLFVEIGGNCLNIIEFLCSDEASRVPVSGDLLNAQYEEERAKARKIRECRAGNAESEYERLIRDAEIKYPFGGAIRFLFTNDSEETDWSDFKTKKANFDRIMAMRAEVKNDNHLSPLVLRTLLSYVETWNVLTGIWDIDSSYDSWKKILLRNQSYIRPAHLMLLNGINEEELKNFESPIKNNDIQKGTHEELVKSEFLHQATWDSFTFRADHMAMVRNSRAQWKKYMLGTPRNRLIAEGVKNEKIIMVENRMLGDGEHFWGESLLFEFAGNQSEFVFRWNGTEFHRAETWKNDVYVCERDNGDQYFPNDDEREEFAIKVDYNCSYEEFVSKLKELLDKAQNYQSAHSSE